MKYKVFSLIVLSFLVADFSLALELPKISDPGLKKYIGNVDHSQEGVEPIGDGTPEAAVENEAKTGKPSEIKNKDGSIKYKGYHAYKAALMFNWFTDWLRDHQPDGTPERQADIDYVNSRISRLSKALSAFRDKFFPDFDINKRNRKRSGRWAEKIRKMCADLMAIVVDNISNNDNDSASGNEQEEESAQRDGSVISPFRMAILQAMNEGQPSLVSNIGSPVSVPVSEVGNKLSIEAEGAGSTAQINLSITNNTNNDIILTIPVGTVFSPSGSNSQNLMVR